MTDLTNFDNLGLPSFLLQSLERMGISAPTAVQAGSIPPAILGQDILASAQTGSGKTIAYLVPLIMNLLKTPDSRALILLPTRELAQQVNEAFYQLMGRSRDLNSVVLIGGDPIRNQFFQLKRNPQIIIGTPGRICDHLDRRSLMLDDVKYFVLDEVDRMLDMGFSDELEMIYYRLPKTRQTFMFSATLPPNIEKLAQKYLTNPQRVAVGNSQKAAQDIKQEFLHLSHSDKFPNLLKQLASREGSVIVFVKTKFGADQLAEKLKRENHTAEAIHGDLQQRRRERVILGFRNQKNRIMVATDIAARGLDVPHIQHVINYDLPNCPEDYIHRIGRTGRAGAQGFALSLVAPDDIRKWKAINRFMDPKGAAREERSAPRNNNSAPKRKKPHWTQDANKRASTGGRPQQHHHGKPRNEGGRRQPRGESRV